MGHSSHLMYDIPHSKTTAIVEIEALCEGGPVDP